MHLTAFNRMTCGYPWAR